MANAYVEVSAGLTWLMALAEHDVRAVPTVARRNVFNMNGSGAIAYPAIVVITTNPAEKKKRNKFVVVFIKAR